MTLGDLDLLVLGVARDADDLHAVEQGLRNAQRVRGRHEHHVGQVVVDLEVMVVERRVLLWVEHFEEGGRRVAAPVRAEFVDLVEQEERVRGFRLLHPLNDLARHRADVGPAMSADLGLVTHAAQRHPHEVPSGRPGDRLAEGGLAHPWGAHQAEDGSLHLLHALLHGEIFEDALLDLFEPEVIRVEHLLRAFDVAFDLGAVLPGHRQQPVEIVAHDRRLGRHRAHAPEFFQFGDRLVAGLLGKLCLVDAILELGHLVAAVLAFAELLLDRLQLLVQVVLALRLLHLALDAVANPFFDLEDPDFALHVAEHLLRDARPPSPFRAAPASRVSSRSNAPRPYRPACRALRSD